MTTRTSDPAESAVGARVRGQYPIEYWLDSSWAIEAVHGLQLRDLCREEGLGPGFLRQRLQRELRRPTEIDGLGRVRGDRLRLQGDRVDVHARLARETHDVLEADNAGGVLAVGEQGNGPPADRAVVARRPTELAKCDIQRIVERGAAVRRGLVHSLFEPGLLSAAASRGSGPRRQS